jgi:hypothetical protein
MNPEGFEIRMTAILLLKTIFKKAFDFIIKHPIFAVLK